MRPFSKLAARPFFTNEDISEILYQISHVLSSGVLILGPHTKKLEEEFATYVGTKYAVAVSSCSAALEIALRAVGSHGREVIVPTNTFVATANSALRATSGISRGVAMPTNTCAATANAAVSAGGAVVLCESDEADGNFSVDEALAKITDRTAAVVVVHVAGFVPRDLTRLLNECYRKKIAVIEDCAHAHGASMGNLKVGALGDIGCFSFYPTKIMTCGVGGMLTTDNAEVAALARSLRHHGQGASLEDVVAIGSDWLMDEMRAVVARVQLKRLDDMVRHRRLVATRYDVVLRLHLDGVVTPPVAAPHTLPAYYKYPVLLPVGTDRDAVRKKMQDKYGIETGVLYWPPVHKMPAYAALGVNMPRTEALLARRLCLPMHAEVSFADCEEIVLAFKDCL